VAGDVITTGTKAADPARVDAPRGTDPVIDAEQAEAGAADVPGGRAADGAAAVPASPQAAELPTAPESPADDTASARKPPTASTQARPSRARAAVAAVQGQAADVAASMTKRLNRVPRVR